MRSVGAALVERAAQKNKTPALPLRKKAAAEPTTEETARRTTKRPGTAGRQEKLWNQSAAARSDSRSFSIRAAAEAV